MAPTGGGTATTDFAMFQRWEAVAISLSIYFTADGDRPSPRDLGHRPVDRWKSCPQIQNHTVASRGAV